MSHKITSEQLFCEFTQEEIDQKGQQLSTTMLTYDEVETRKKEATAAYREELQGLRGQMRELSKAIRKKGETRPVECRLLFHVPNVGMKRTVRIDTGEIVKDEVMSMEERQENLFAGAEIDALKEMFDKPDPRQSEDTEPQQGEDNA